MSKSLKKNPRRDRVTVAQGTIFDDFRTVLFSPIDIASLVYFRIAFGAILLWEVCRYFQHGWIARYYIEPTFHFTYYGFEWVRPLSGAGMFTLFILLGVLAIAIVFGVWYRLATVCFFLMFTYVFLLDQARYLNHFYLVSLMSLLMVFMPAHRAFSFDSWMRPKIRARTVPAWTLWLLRAQIGIAYFYAGIAKINLDWLHAEPLRHWLAKRADYTLLGPLFAHEETAWVFSYCGLFLDLFIVPFLIWRQTRPFAFAIAVGFHLSNAFIFRIGIFPWFMIAATLLFFSPDWPRRLLHWVFSFERSALVSQQRSAKEGISRNVQTVTMTLLAIYLTFQILFPFRHFLYPGDVNWTEEGHRFSWRMKLRTKLAKARFIAADPNAKTTSEINPRKYLEKWQIRTMSSRPDMLLQFAHFLGEQQRKKGSKELEIHVIVQGRLNWGPPQLLIDPRVDLVKQERNLWPAAWIVPLKKRPTKPSPL